MTTLFYLFGALTILIAIIMILVVVIQNSKGGGLNSTFGATQQASQIFGARRSAENVEKFTWYLFAALCIFAFVANISGSMASNTGPDGLRLDEQINAYNPEGVSQVPSFQEQAAPTEGTGEGIAPSPAATEPDAPAENE